MALYGQAATTLVAPGALFGVNGGDEGLQLDVAFLQQRRALGGSGQRRGGTLCRVPRSLRCSGNEDPIDDGFHRAQLRMDFLEEAVESHRELQDIIERLVDPRFHRRDEHHKVAVQLEFPFFGQNVLDRHPVRAVVPFDSGRIPGDRI